MFILDWIFFWRSKAGKAPKALQKEFDKVVKFSNEALEAARNDFDAAQEALTRADRRAKFHTELTDVVTQQANLENKAVEIRNKYADVVS